MRGESAQRPNPTRCASRAIRCIGQRRALYCRTKFRCVELVRIGRQANLDIAQTLAPSYLRKGHRAKLLGARQTAHACVAVVTVHDAMKARLGHELHDLGEQSLANVHRCSSGWTTLRNYPNSDHQDSNQHQIKSTESPHQCLFYDLVVRI